jgi:hypothetical protein
MKKIEATVDPVMRTARSINARAEAEAIIDDWVVDEVGKAIAEAACLDLSLTRPARHWASS